MDDTLNQALIMRDELGCPFSLKALLNHEHVLLKSTIMSLLKLTKLELAVYLHLPHKKSVAQEKQALFLH
jgi:hypothetical protein